MGRMDHVYESSACFNCLSAQRSMIAKARAALSGVKTFNTSKIKDHLNVSSSCHQGMESTLHRWLGSF